MQPTSTTIVRLSPQKFHCRGCNVVHKRAEHSQKTCIKKKQDEVKRKLDIEYERTAFIQKFNLAKKTLKRKAEPIDQTELFIKKYCAVWKNHQFIEPICDQKPQIVNQSSNVEKIPKPNQSRVAKQKKIAPIQHWYGHTHHRST